MNTKFLHRGFALLAFVVSLVTYSLTVQKTVPFWDCAEFTAAAVQQQVPHPPGAPLFLMVGKLFHDYIPFGDPGWRVNMVSVFASAFCVLLTYLITVQVINQFRSKSPSDLAEALAVYGSGLVGALAFNFSDTFWFNGVESEVYAASTLFVALIVWLMMRWNEEADNAGHERYLLLIAYLIGLSTGVHLLSVLTIFSIVMVVYYRKYTFSWQSFFVMGAIAVVIFIIIYPGIVKWYPAMLGGESPFKNEAKEYLIENSPVMTLLAILFVGGAGYGVWYGIKKHRSLVALAGTAFILMIIGYSTYTQILIRSNARPPMNENAPNNLDKLTSYLGREQYGDRSFWPRRHEGESYIEQTHKKYGEWYKPRQRPVERKDGSQIGLPVYERINTAGELSYLISYQVYEMYVRYFLWNFSGRASDAQGAPSALFEKNFETYNYDSGYAHLFPIRFFGLPLFFGMIGLVYHIIRNRRMASVYVVLFLMTGVLAAISQNQQNPQPRERDYFYVGSFMVFCVWIGVGVFALIENMYKERMKLIGTALIPAFALVLVPVNMAVGGWKIHDRSGNYIPFDYAYNILQSVEKDAIIFTNGDNDTFSLWYMQDVEGVRRDVRIVNLSLGQTLWYVNQLKNETPWGAKKIPLSFSDASLQATDEYSKDALSYDVEGEHTVTIPVKPEILAQYTNNPAVISAGSVTLRMVGSRALGEREGKQMYVWGVQDKLVQDILQVTRFERPVYFSKSVGGDVYCGLDNHLRLEGMALRVCPVPQVPAGRGGTAVSEDITDKIIFNVLEGDTFHRDQQYSMKLRNLNTINVYYDEPNRLPVQNYRSMFLNYAFELASAGKNEKAVRILSTMDKYIDPTQFTMPYPMAMQLADLYERCGGKEGAQRYAQITLKHTEKLINSSELMSADPYVRSYPPYIIASEAYQLLGQFDNAVAVLNRYKVQNNNAPEIQALIDQIDITRAEKEGNLTKALETAERLVATYRTSTNETLKSLVPGLERKILELRLKAGGASLPSPAIQP